MKKLKVGRAAVWLLLGVGLVACQRGADAQIHTLRRGLSGEPATLDPVASGDSFSGQVLLDLYEGLTAESPVGDAVPAAASTWEVDARGTRYTFHIRPDAKWSNGKPLLARHFVQSWQHVVDPRSASSGADDLSIISGARRIISGLAQPRELAAHAVDDRTLVIDLERPAPFFPGLLSHTSTFPRFLENGSPSHDPKDWISNGAYLLKEWRPGTHIQLTKNNLYWNSNKVLITEVEYQFSSDENAQYARYRAGQLDMTDTVPLNALRTIRSSVPGELVVTPYLGTAYYGLNLRSGSLSKSPDLRKALSMAIDRNRLVALMGFGQAPAYGLVPPRVWNYDPQLANWHSLQDEPRIAEAQRLYGLAGYSRVKPLRVTVLFNSSTAIKQTAIQIASMWKEVLGVETKLEEEEYRVFLESRHDPARFDIARLAWVADFNDAGNFLDTLRKDSSNNDEGYNNARYDGLLDQAASAADTTERRELLQLAEREMLMDGPVIPLYHYVSKRLVKPYVIGVSPSPLDRVASKDIRLANTR